MKALFALILISSAAPAFANQILECKQVDKKGVVLAKGGSLTVNLTKKTVKTSGFTRDRDDTRFSDLEIRSINQNALDSQNAYTTLFLTPVNDDGMLDIQLQFDAHIVGQTFQSEHANFVIGSDDANPETSFAFGYDVSCESRLK